MPEHYTVRPNKYGGYFVVDSAGAKAPRPFGFNSRENAELRAIQLNAGGALPSREFGASESVSSPANPPQTDAPKEADRG